MNSNFDEYLRETAAEWESEITRHEKFPLWEKDKTPMFDKNAGQNEPSDPISDKKRLAQRRGYYLRGRRIYVERTA